MKPDWYTKVVLTVIAGALVWLCIRDTAPTVHARAISQEVVRIAGVDDDRNPIAVKIVGIERAHWVANPGQFNPVERSMAWEAIPVATR
jgi:hypothetical protein